MSEDTGPDGTRAEAPPGQPTGNHRVDAVLERAAELDATPVAEHAAIYDELHAALVAELEAERGTVPAGLEPEADTSR